MQKWQVTANPESILAGALISSSFWLWKRAEKDRKEIKEQKAKEQQEKEAAEQQAKGQQQQQKGQERNQERGREIKMNTNKINAL